MYLMIRNKGVCPAEAFTVMGVSITRDNGEENTIGQFGTGAKYSIALLLRKRLIPHVFCGNLKMKFSIQAKSINDGIGSAVYHQIKVDYSGKDENNRTNNRTELLGYTTSMGTSDWNHIGMAMREFISNAIDRTIRGRNSLSDVEISIVTDNQVRAKSGYTSVFIPVNGDVERYYVDLEKHFLHFDNTIDMDSKILRKGNRNLNPDNHSAVIFKKGVRVREITGTPSLFDYNLGSELRLDESRLVDDYSAKSQAAKALANSSVDNIQMLIDAVINNHNRWETEFSSYDLFGYSGVSEDAAKAWKKAWELETSTNSVCVINRDPRILNKITAKGYNPILVSGSWYEVFQKIGIMCEADVITLDESNGMEFSDPTPDVLDTFQKIWDKLDSMGLILPDKEKPEIRCFYSIMEAGCQTFGIQRGNMVAIHRDIATNSDMLSKVALEEMCHYVSGAGDETRDLQDFLFRVLQKLLG